MSYILKALRKSEAERAKGAVPRLTPHHEPSAPRQGSVWPWVAVAALVVNAVIGGAVLWRSDIVPWLQEAGFGPDAPVAATTMPESPSAQAAAASRALTAAAPPTAESAPVFESQISDTAPSVPNAPQQPARSPVEAPSAEIPDPGTSTPVTAAAPPQKAAPDVAKPPAESEVTDAPESAARIVDAIEQTPSPTIAKARPEPAKALPLAPEPPRKPTEIEDLAVMLAATNDQDDRLDEELPWDEDQKGIDVPLGDDDPLPPDFAADQAADLYENIPMLWQMPRTFRSRLPSLNISVHVYSPDEPGRFVIIDRKKYWEGDNLLDGVVLEAIVPDGVVMEFQGQQFRLSSR